MRPYAFLYLILFSLITVAIITGSSGCAQIGAPTGGPRDTLPPRLTNASPALKSTGFSGNRINLTFDEYIEVKDIQNNVLISPVPKANPVISYKLKTVSIRLKDTLLPNTTYSINFGNAITDINENNPFTDFTYVFSTGKTIDSLILTGKVSIAETGETDSTLIVLLYRNAVDSSVRTRRPDYVARLKGDGSFQFNNLPYDNFSIYALKDGDGGKTYNSKTEVFAFNDKTIPISLNTAPVLLYAYAEEKEKPKATTSPKNTDKRLRYTTSGGRQELLAPFRISFLRPLKKFDPSKIILTDTNYIAIPDATVTLDSTRTSIAVDTKWKDDQQYRLLFDKDAASDSIDNVIPKSDTIRIVAMNEENYGRLVLRFSNLDLSSNPVLQFVSGEEIKESHVLRSNEWSKKLFNPGDYTIRILYDDNKNGKWDPGNYSLKRQPEKVVTLPQKLNIKANWDNEREIRL